MQSFGSAPLDMELPKNNEKYIFLNYIYVYNKTHYSMISNELKTEIRGIYEEKVTFWLFYIGYRKK